MGVSVCEPKVTVAPEATLSAAMASGKETPPAGAAIGEKLMMAGAPAPLVAVITAKVALFETTDALATETLRVPEEETSFEGTITDIVSHCAMLAGQLTGAETDEGESVSLPKRRIYVTSRPVPVIPSVKLPLPAGTLVGEIERMAGVRFKIKDFRPTFAQLNKDRNVGIEAVSKMLRHRTTRTTELFYARIRDEKAFAEAERAWGVGISIPAD